MRLIDADANIETMKKCAANPESEQALLCYRFAQKILEEAPTAEPASPWHRVEEPPKDSKPVLCWEKQGFPYVDRYFPKYGWEFANSALAEPIYWMPIEPPEEIMNE